MFTNEPEAPANNPIYTFKKNFISNKDTAAVPDVSFGFGIAPADASELKGDTKQGVGSPVIGTAGFTGESAFDTPVDVTVDFTGVAFPSAGTYRYKITENTVESVDGITNDSNDARYLDVYVENTDDNGLRIAYYVMNASAGDDSEKSDGFENRYDVFDLSLTKEVTGSAGDKMKDFTFAIAFDGSTIEGANIVALKNGSADGITVENGTYTVPLKHGETVTLTGIPKGAKYGITESGGDGYETTVSVSGDDTENDAADGKFADDSITGDTSVTFTNNRDSVLPTGVMLSVAVPVIAGVVIVGVIIAIVVVKKKDRDDEDDDD